MDLGAQAGVAALDILAAAALRDEEKGEQHDAENDGAEKDVAGAAEAAGGSRIGHTIERGDGTFRTVVAPPRFRASGVFLFVPLRSSLRSIGRVRLEAGQRALAWLRERADSRQRERQRQRPEEHVGGRGSAHQTGHARGRLPLARGPDSVAKPQTSRASAPHSNADASPRRPYLVASGVRDFTIHAPNQEGLARRECERTG